MKVTGGPIEKLIIGCQQWVTDGPPVNLIVGCLKWTTVYQLVMPPENHHKKFIFYIFFIFSLQKKVDDPHQSTVLATEGGIPMDQ